MGRISNIFRWIYGCIMGKPTNFKWVMEGKLAGSGVPSTRREIAWLFDRGIRSIVSIKEKPLPAGWFENIGMDNFHISVKDKEAPSVQKLDQAINHISDKINEGKPVVVHCSGGKGRTGTILAAYFVKAEKLNANEAITRVSAIRGEALQSSEQEKVVYDYENFLKV